VISSEPDLSALDYFCGDVVTLLTELQNLCRKTGDIHFFPSLLRSQRTMLQALEYSIKLSYSSGTSCGTDCFGSLDTPSLASSARKFAQSIPFKLPMISQLACFSASSFSFF